MTGLIAVLVLMTAGAEPQGATAAPAAATASTDKPAATPALPGVTGSPVRVERRILVKERHFLVTGGASYLSRGDYYFTPGLSGTAAFFPEEPHGAEVRVDIFFAFLTPSATEVFDATGLVPVAHRPVARLAAGYRFAAAYGKLLLGGVQGSVAHFELHFAGHLGAFITDRTMAPVLDLGPGLLVRLPNKTFLQLDVPFELSFEQTARGFLNPGVLPSLTAGWLF